MPEPLIRELSAEPMKPAPPVIKMQSFMLTPNGRYNFHNNHQMAVGPT